MAGQQDTVRHITEKFCNFVTRSTNMERQECTKVAFYIIASWSLGAKEQEVNKVSPLVTMPVTPGGERD
jgi:hypothetical protein